MKGEICTKIPAELVSAAPNGIVTSADGVYDYKRSKNQEDINQQLFQLLENASSNNEIVVGISAKWFTGTEDLDNNDIENSNIGDLYLNTENYNIYKKESPNIWTYQCNIKGQKGDTGFRGSKGDKGDKGDKGEQGPQGEPGMGIPQTLSIHENFLSISNGNTVILPSSSEAGGRIGEDGLSAYQIWLNNGNSGSESDFLESLQGPPGQKGDTGNGITSIIKTNTSGLIDTYTITYTNGETDIFTITNGSNGEFSGTIASGEQIDELFVL